MVPGKGRRSLCACALENKILVSRDFSWPLCYNQTQTGVQLVKMVFVQCVSVLSGSRLFFVGLLMLIAAYAPLTTGQQGVNYDIK